MLAIYATLALAAVSSVSAAPFHKRIAQVISDSTAEWEQACLAAGGAQQCNPLSVAAFTTLLAAADPCAQQTAAENMIDLAHQLNSDAEMIRLTQLFRQQPRNAPDSLSVFYCGQDTRSQELEGLFQCQFQGVNDNVFGSAASNVPVGSAGTIPFGLSSPVSPPGSCPANPGGKIPDGQQLNTIVSDPGTGSSSGSNNDTTPPPAATTAVESAPETNEPATTTAAAVVATPSQNTGTSSSGSGFALSNAQQAQAQNVQFESLAEGSPCTVGEVACIGGNFAQCPFGTFVTTGCAGGTQCIVLPLVNSVGTSVTCTTLDDAARRFAAAGATGGFDGNH